MASIFDPSSRIPNPTPEQQQSLFQQWQEYLTPERQRGLRQFGLSMLAPAAPGTSFLSKFGGAVGDAEEAVDRSREASNVNAKAVADATAQQARLAEETRNNNLLNIIRGEEIKQGNRRLDQGEQGLSIQAHEAQTRRMFPGGTAGTTASPNEMAKVFAEAVEAHAMIPPEQLPISEITQQPMTAVEYGHYIREQAFPGAKPIQADAVDALAGDVAGPVATGATPPPKPVEGPTLTPVPLVEYDTKFPKDKQNIARQLAAGNFDEAIRQLTVIQGRVSDPASVQALIDQVLLRKAAAAAAGKTPPIEPGPTPPPGTRPPGRNPIADRYGG